MNRIEAAKYILEKIINDDWTKEDEEFWDNVKWIESKH